MLVIRPILRSDFDGLKQIAIDSGSGFTSLPVDDERLAEKIDHSVHSISSTIEERGEEGYLFVLEDTTTGKIVGTTAIEASVGLTTPMYHYHITSQVHVSSALNSTMRQQLLTMCNDYTGVSEICTLFLEPDYRKTKAGRLLSKVRFMFMADNPERFSETVIAEMRGAADENGQPPFWNWLQQGFFHIDFCQADLLVGTGKKQFIADLMPKYPIYVSTLPKAAQEVIGQVHQNTKPALRLLEKEGFEHNGYVDLFDAGPTVEAKVQNVKSVRDSLLMKVEILDSAIAANEDAQYFALCNQEVTNFRATFSQNIIVNTSNGSVAIDAELADALHVNQGDTLRVLAL
jgi:arginine N-succinyltransferase